MRLILSACVMARMLPASNHRIACGDSADPSVVALAAGGDAVDLVFTSPPYMLQRSYGGGLSKPKDWFDLMVGVFGNLPVHDGSQVLVNLGVIHDKGEWFPYWDQWVGWMRECGWRRFGWYVWDQGPGLPGDWNGRLAPSHEFIFHFNKSPARVAKTVRNKGAGRVSHKPGRHRGDLRAKDGHAGYWTHGGRQTQVARVADSVFRVMRHKGGLGGAGSHPAVFPVPLVEQVYRSFSAPGRVVYDPFLGSGSSIIAAELLDRRCVAVEVVPGYVDVCLKRFALKFNEVPINAETGAQFGG